MNGKLEQPVRSAATWLAGGAALAAAGYAAYAGVTWARYGKSKKPVGSEIDPLLDRFMPDYEAVDRHEAMMPAPAEVVLSCGSGVTACHNLLAMEHAGLHGARVYAPSWSGWVSEPARPVATGG